MSAEQRCGRIALMGRPNMGKSTLLNAILGQKIAGVSAKPQTTRNQILGIHTEGQSQLLFLDTPGIHRQKKGQRLNSLMNREAWTVLDQADLVLFLVDCQRGWQDEDRVFLKAILEQGQVPVEVLLSKVDRLKKAECEQVCRDVVVALQALKDSLDAEAADRLVSTQVLQISAKRRESVQGLLQHLQTKVPFGPWQYPEEDLTDRSQNFVASELIREQVFRCLGEELPYSSAVRIDKLEFAPPLVRIYASIIVARASHKGMVIGKRAVKIKEIGMAARQTLEQHFESKVFLDLQVVVDENWLDNVNLVAEYSHLGDT